MTEQEYQVAFNDTDNKISRWAVLFNLSNIYLKKNWDSNKKEHVIQENQADTEWHIFHLKF